MVSTGETGNLPQGVTRWRKKPVAIQAWQLTHANPAELAAWCGGRQAAIWQPTEPPVLKARLVIPTLEGDHYAVPGDWIIRGVQGEFYPCKPDIFAATYEPASEPEGTTSERQRCADEVRAKADELDGNVVPPEHRERASAYVQGMRQAAEFILHGDVPQSGRPDGEPR